MSKRTGNRDGVDRIGSLNIPGVGWKTLDEVAEAFRAGCTVSVNGYVVSAPTSRELLIILHNLSAFRGLLINPDGSIPKRPL